MPSESQMTRIREWLIAESKRTDIRRMQQARGG